MAEAVQQQDFVSREEYYRWRETQTSGRFERIDGFIVAMAPERGAHLRAKAAAWLSLRRAIDVAGADCQALPDGATIATGESDYEPDAVVNCGPPMADDALTVPNPLIVVEVLSPSTQSADTSAKLTGYFAVPSVRHYLIVHPARQTLIHHQRSATTAGAIDTQILSEGKLRLDPPGLIVEVADFFE